MASIRDKQRKLSLDLRDDVAELQRVDVAGPLPSTTGVEAARWRRVETLEVATETWPDQLTRWREDGRELLTIVAEGDRYRALLERRV